MQQTANERRFPISKEVLDTVNSVAWFLADASWMTEYLPLAFMFMVPTILSGLCLLYIEKRPSVLMINIAINCWILMNFLWILSDADLNGPYLVFARACFMMGVLFIILSLLMTRSLRETFSHFRRFRSPKN